MTEFDPEEDDEEELIEKLEELKLEEAREDSKWGDKL